MWTHRQSPPLRNQRKVTNHMKTSTQNALPVAVSRLVRPLRLSGKTFTNPKGDWIKIEWVSGNDISYNCSGSCQWAGGRLRCSRAKIKAILDNILPTNAEVRHGGKDANLD